MPAPTLDAIVSLCKRRGFIFPSSQIYGGIQGCYDYGPMGVELKNHLKNTWWRDMVHMRDDVEGLDASILTHRKTLHYSGHEATFTDPMVDCRACQSRHRADHLVNQTCPNCGSTDLTEPRPFNLMFQTQVGPIANADHTAYLRPETAQAIFGNFHHIRDCSPHRLPFGIAQIGKAFRNEITPRQFIFRVREFEQMECEFFVHPDQDQYWHAYWVEERYQWWCSQGLDPSRLHKVVQPAEELSHYAKATTDLLYQYPHGTEEIEGIANRSDFDLGAHSKDQAGYHIQAQVPDNSHSTQRLGIPPTPNQNDQPLIPFVIEPSAGVDRGVLAILCEAYHEETLAQAQSRIVLKLKPHLSPIKAAVIPLAKNKPALVELAQRITQTLKAALPGRVVLENTGNIGKNYRKHDEIGTPVCITVDFDSLADTSSDENLVDTVTVRDRDSLQQKRILIAELADYLRQQYFHYQHHSKSAE